MTLSLFSTQGGPVTWIKDLQSPLPLGAPYSVYIGLNYFWRVTLIMNWNLARTRATCGIFISWLVICAPCSGMVKNLPAMWETWVQSPGGEDPLEKETVINSSILAWEIPWTEKHIVGYSPRGLKESDTNTFTFSLFIHPNKIKSNSLQWWL